MMLLKRCILHCENNKAFLEKEVSVMEHIFVERACSEQGIVTKITLWCMCACVHVCVFVCVSVGICLHLWMDFKIIRHNFSPQGVGVPFEPFIPVGQRSRPHL